METVTLRAIATDNLVSRNLARTPVSELQSLARLLVGKPCTTDHNTYDVTREWATVETAWVEAALPPEFISPINEAIVTEEGYHQVLCTLSVPKDCLHLLAFERGLGLRISIQFMYTYPRCPGCACGKNYWHPACPNDYEDISHLERIGVFDAYELSLVLVPAVAAARVLF